jgi:hypothetical protein
METRNINGNIVVTGILLLLSGIITATMAVEPAAVLRYMNAGILVSAGVFGLITGQESIAMNGQSKYYTGLGLIVISLAMSLGIFGTTAIAFISILGFFLLLLGTVSFAFAQQLLVDRIASRTIAGVKFLVGTLMAIGGTWIITIPDTHTNIAFLVSGGLFALNGMALIHLGRMSRIEEIKHPGI